MLYPLKFKPILKEKIWGGDKLKYKADYKDYPIGESWEVSGVEGSISVVENGSLEGRSLQDLLHEFKGELVGNSVYEKFEEDFPILIKFIDAKDDLSVQLHPDDLLAKQRHGSFGKTEMWYILETEDKASLVLDFKDKITPTEYQEILNNNQLKSALNIVKVSPGDAFFIKPGLVHAIGAGVLLAEIQQTSDITYRLYDWDRKDSNNNERELHTDLALEAIDFSHTSDFKIDYTPRLNTKVTLADTPFFKTQFIHIEGQKLLDYSKLDSFVIFMNIGSQEANLTYDGKVYTILEKQTILIPAQINSIEIESKSTRLLEISI